MDYTDGTMKFTVINNKSGGGTPGYNTCILRRI